MLVPCDWDQIHQFIFNYKKGTFHSNKIGLMSIKIVKHFFPFKISSNNAFIHLPSPLTWKMRFKKKPLPSLKELVCIVICVDNFYASRLSAPVFLVSFDKQFRLAKVFQGLAYKSHVEFYLFYTSHNLMRVSFAFFCWKCREWWMMLIEFSRPFLFVGIEWNVLRNEWDTLFPLSFSFFFF